MNRAVNIGIFIVLLFLFSWGCSEKPDVEVSYPGPHAVDNNVTVARINANLLQHRPRTMMEKPEALRMVNQGDQITTLETQGDWSKVQHVLSGQIGWLNNSFIQIESKTKWWSGDTDTARKVAEKIFKNKIFMEQSWPVIHIGIEERWNKCVLTVKEDADFPKSDATECASFVLDHLLRDFPGWRDHQVFLDAKTNGEPYSFVISDERVPTFF
ncbi:SH3 domain-containing protein [bacterium]|nr:SH3 domain-containing protein [candidate division CSSED10-310 bacterium]